VGDLDRALQILITILEKDNEGDHTELDRSTDMGSYNMINLFF